MADDPVIAVCIREPPFKTLHGTSLVVQWAGICLPMQETQVRSLVGEDSTHHGVTKARVTQLLKPERLEPVLHSKGSPCGEKPTHHHESSPHSPQLEKAEHRTKDPAQSNINKQIIFKNQPKNTPTGGAQVADRLVSP